MKESPMNGTNHSTYGFRRITRQWPQWNIRLALFALAVGLGVFLIVRIQGNVGSRMAQLEQEFGAIKAEGFYVGVQMRVLLRRLNEQLLDCQLSRDPADGEAFLKEANDLKQWLKRREVNLDTARERQLYEQIETAYDQYLAEAKPAAETLATPVEPAAFITSYRAVRQNSRHLLNLIEDFVVAQQAAFNAFLRTSQGTLLSLRWLLDLSLLLLLASTMTLVVLVYRGMIAPLRRVLTQSQAVIQQQEKLASLGTLAAGVAHEIRNPLTALKFRLFSLKKVLPTDFAGQEDTLVMSAELNRLERIVKDFLEFARPSDPEVVRLPAQRLLQEVRDLLAAQLEKTAISLQFESSSPVPVWISADSQQIKQVLINLVQNAAESIGSNGTITLRLRSRTDSLAGRACPVAILSVADTGPGIPAEVQNRLFDPFFTTKDGGTGLGLAIAARIVNKHGGVLHYQTKLDRGTTFEIVLPRSDDYDTTSSAH